MIVLKLQSPLENCGANSFSSSFNARVQAPPSGDRLTVIALLLALPYITEHSTRGLQMFEPL